MSETIGVDLGGTKMLLGVLDEERNVLWESKERSTGQSEDELSRDYVTAARARGLSLRAAVLRHVLRNASIPIVTIAALEVGNLLAGAVIVETVFAWPGIGQLAIQSIAARDFLVVQAIVLFVSTVYIAMNLLADIAYAVIDPRIRLER